MREFDRIYKRGLAQVARWYRLAVAAQLRGDVTDASEAWERYKESLAQVLLLTRLSGIAYAYQAAQKQGLKIKPSDWPDKRPDTFAVGTQLAFRPGLFWEAVLAFRRKVPLAFSEVLRIRAEMRSLAAHIAITENQSALRAMTQRLDILRQVLSGSFRIKGATFKQAERIKRLLAEAIETSAIPKGLKIGSLSRFIRRAQIEGVIGLTTARMETVYRTNIASAFNEATADTMDSAAVATWAPLLRLVEIHDPRTRGAPGGVYKGKSEARNPGFHWQMNGYIATAAEFKMQGLVPPNGFNCRGSLVPVTRDEAEDMGLISRDGSLDRQALARYNAQRQQIIDRGLYPDPGFKR